MPLAVVLQPKVYACLIRLKITLLAIGAHHPHLIVEQECVEMLQLLIRLIVIVISS